MAESSGSKRQALASSTLQALGLELHSKVTVSGNVGILRFCGATDFASGQWAGVELADGVGKNDGTVAGVCYFKCPPKHGVFAPLSRVHRYQGGQHNATTGGVQLSITESSSDTTERTDSSDEAELSDGIHVGDFVEVDDERSGVVRYIGATKFASGTWVGIEAANPNGRSDGTVAGVEYFQCKHKHGIFVPIEKVKAQQNGGGKDSKKIEADSLDPSVSEGPSSSINNNNNNNNSNNNSNNNKPDIVKTTKPDNREAISSNIPVPTNRKPKKKQSAGSKNNITKACHDKNSATTSTPKKSPKTVDQTFGADIEFVLKTGMSVFVNNEMGVVRYIGRVEFADNVWLGIELRAGNGKNDGTVENKRYFTCKPGFGLMVRPGRVTCRGINCDLLIDPKLRDKIIIS